ncbi:Uma2 family endonuclease [Phormidium sp. CLA17]|uniref:Uma2 family endonuclease n=1 Tax=Leptolyngbya sp. Cla-17 TaxID=2803751 RepID=UPI0014912324|nr:Uma2 family endonuclease [Leptolyngbya sp. Cla-17]MBM0741295.1 Uma2 family endonuclease [Leptolyngbya sp. Cla-17]
MVATPTKPLTLDEFLALPETEPASEFVDGKIVQKPMPKRKHSVIQAKLTAAINQIAEPQKLAFAFPELRCTFDNRSLVPDVVVLEWQTIEFDADGEPTDDVFVAPDWTIEILSPNQSANSVIDKILHCVNNGTQLGWLIDASDRSVLTFTPNQTPRLYADEQSLPVLDKLTLVITPVQVFSWLKLGQD